MYINLVKIHLSQTSLGSIKVYDKTVENSADFIIQIIGLISSFTFIVYTSYNHPNYLYLESAQVVKDFSIENFIDL